MKKVLVLIMVLFIGIAISSCGSLTNSTVYNADDSKFIGVWVKTNFSKSYTYDKVEFLAGSNLNVWYSITSSSSYSYTWSANSSTKKLSSSTLTFSGDDYSFSADGKVLTVSYTTSSGTVLGLYVYKKLETSTEEAKFAGTWSTTNSGPWYVKFSFDTTNKICSAYVTLTSTSPSTYYYTVETTGSLILWYATSAAYVYNYTFPTGGLSMTVLSNTYDTNASIFTKN